MCFKKLFGICGKQQQPIILSSENRHSFNKSYDTNCENSVDIDNEENIKDKLEKDNLITSDTCFEDEGHHINLEDPNIFSHYIFLKKNNLLEPWKIKLINIIYLLSMTCVILFGFGIFLLIIELGVAYSYNFFEKSNVISYVITLIMFFLFSCFVLVSTCATLRYWKESFKYRILFIQYSNKIMYYGEHINPNKHNENVHLIV